MKAQRSLKSRALQLLAQREQSRVELRRKLLPHARAEDAAAVLADSVVEIPAGTRVDAVLDWLEANEYLSAERFVEARVHARASRFGNLRIRQELKQHQLSMSPSAAQALGDSELQRARSVRERKFVELPSSSADRAKQARFLASRGFSFDVIGRALRAEAVSHDSDLLLESGSFDVKCASSEEADEAIEGAVHRD